MFRRCPVRISTRTPDILTESFRGFPQSLQPNARTVPQIRPRPPTSTSLLIHYLLIFMPLDAIKSELLTVSLNRPQIIFKEYEQTLCCWDSCLWIFDYLPSWYINRFVHMFTINVLIPWYVPNKLGGVITLVISTAILFTLTSLKHCGAENTCYRLTYLYKWKWI
jgi:hypothetical protein